MSEPHKRPELFEMMTWPEVREAIDAGLPILLPVGSIEQHGPHMPLGTDAFVPYELAKRVAAKYRAIVMPPVFYGAYSRPRSGGGRTFPGSTGVPGSALEPLITALLQDLMRQGFRSIAVINGHFENQWTLLEALEKAIEPYEGTHKALLIGWWEQIPDTEVRRVFGDAFPGWATEHASLVETSVMEELMPDLVRTDLKRDGGAPRTISYEVYPPPNDIIWPTGVGFSAAGASRQLGSEIVHVVVDGIVAALDVEFGGPE